MDKDKTKKEDGIRLPMPIVIVMVLAVLGILLDQLAGVIDYCREEEPRIIRIVMRSLSMLGWGLIECYLLHKLWEYRKRKKTMKNNEEKQEA